MLVACCVNKRTEYQNHEEVRKCTDESETCYSLISQCLTTVMPLIVRNTLQLTQH